MTYFLATILAIIILVLIRLRRRAREQAAFERVRRDYGRFVA